jgi:hypothetical protein
MYESNDLDSSFIPSKMHIKPFYVKGGGKEGCETEWNGILHVSMIGFSAKNVKQKDIILTF